MDNSPKTIRKENSEARLVRALRNGDAKRRQAAAETLGDMRPTDEIVVAALLETMHDPNEEVRAAVASALGTIGELGSNTQEAIAYLLEASGDPCERVREAADNAFMAVLEDSPGSSGG